jgi:polysaccharide deacetylase 2 family uncharacterized protein YibQ
MKPLLLGLLVLVLGGSLGAGIYFLTMFDTRDLFGLFDVADPTPKLSLELPGRDTVRRVGALITPPGAPEGASSGDPGAMLKAVPDDTPPPPASIPAQEKPPGPAVAAAPAPAEAHPGEAHPAEAHAPEAHLGEAGQPPVPQSAPSAPLVAAPLPAPPALASAVVPPSPSPRAADQAPTFTSLPARADAVKPLPAAPVKDLVRQTQAGAVPVVGTDGRQPWQVYARPYSGPERGRLAVVVMDLGLETAATDAAITRLPPEVTLAFSPYAYNLDAWMKKARDSGHEVLLGLPAEPAGYPSRDPGPFAMLTSASPEDNLARLETVLARGSGYAGLISTGERFAASAQLGAVLASVKDHGLLYVGNGTGAGDRAPPAAAIAGQVDQEPYREAIEARLAQAVDSARRDGRALVVATARPLTLDRMVNWLAKLPDQRITVVPASAVVQQGSPGKS